MTTHTHPTDTELDNALDRANRIAIDSTSVLAVARILAARVRESEAKIAALEARHPCAACDRNSRPLPLAAPPAPAAAKACACVPPYGRAFGGTDATRCGDCGLPRPPAPAPPVATAAVDVGALVASMREMAASQWVELSPANAIALLDELEDWRLRALASESSQSDVLESRDRTTTERYAATRELALERAAVERLSTARDALQVERDTLCTYRDALRGEVDATKAASLTLTRALESERDEARAILSEIADAIGEGWSEYLPESARLVIAALAAVTADRDTAVFELATLRSLLAIVPEVDTLAAAQQRYVNARIERDALDAEVKRLRTQAVGT